MSPESSRTTMSQSPEDDGNVVKFPATTDSSIAVQVSQDSIARAFTERHGDDFRYDCIEGTWYEWNGTYWCRDRKRKALACVRKIASELSRGERSICSYGVVSGAERLARTDKRHVVLNDIWDREPMLLGTPSGTVDLKTGKLRSVSREDHISKITSVAPETGTPTRWLQFLDEATGGDHATIRFLQQFIGLCLTGITKEHALLFLLGPGGNGKGVFLNTVMRIMGDYAVVAPMETFIAAKHDRHPTELAMMCGARIVSASETEQGRRWAEARIKSLTGGDPIRARFMHRDFFQYVPTYKLIFTGNHAPGLSNVDPAIQRRLNFVPFNYEPPARDLNLEGKLAAEHGQILNWAKEGCLDWQENGLIRPIGVTLATQNYFLEHDVIQRWLNECCEISDTKRTSAADLFSSYKSFAEGEGVQKLSAAAFGRQMGKRGYTKTQQRLDGPSQKVYLGIGLRPVPDGGADDDR